MPPLTEESLPPQDELLPLVTRGRESRERKREKSREKPRNRQQKRVKPAKQSRLTSTLIGIGKALEERTRWKKWRRERTPTGRTTSGTVDEEVLSEVFSKLGIETKIDQIEAEFNAEAKAARMAARKIKPAAEEPPPREVDLPTQFDRTYGNPATHVHHHRFWTIAVSVLGIILVIQSVFLFRNHIARSFPGTRPALVSLCETFGCTMPLPRDASQLKVTYGFNKRDDHHYVLYATVTNNAGFAQDWPSLELILLNFIEQPLSRRIFTPAEWVQPETLAKGDGIAPGSSVPTHLELEVTGVVPSKADLTHVYP
jgi:hypothetical protein